ncbi:CBS domain-containing protein [Cryptobacterium curtum]|uniref:CBS domain-containing protein n=1 Tax=Cryptobacterium curtum TaxID=84163 RepID=UPI00248EB8A6|nr:CBS domain-containing protein [Cryptobacterium curtum]
MGIVSAITIGPTLGPIVAGGILAFTDCRSLFIVFIALVLAALVLAFVSVGDIASTCLAALNVDDTLEHACTILSDKRIKKAPVLDHSKLIGIVTRSGLMRRILDAAAIKNKCLCYTDRTLDLGNIPWVCADET